MATITIEVDIDEFRTEDIINEFLDRWAGMNENQKKMVKYAISKHQLEGKSVSGPTIEDVLKKEHLDKVFEKYTLSHIESVLPV